MSALTDRLHAWIVSVVGSAENEAAALAAHFAPLVEEARVTIVADVEKLIADAKVDEAKLAALIAAEVAKLTGNTPAPAPVTPPVTPAAAS